MPARFDEERARAHRGIADLELEDLLRSRRTSVLAAQPREHRLERGANDWLGERPRRVVRAGLAALFARLKHHRTGRHHVRRRRGVDHRCKRGVQILNRLCCLDRSGQLRRQLAVCVVGQPLRALAGLFRDQLLEVDRRRRAVAASGPDRHRPPGCQLEPEAHHRLVHRADLLDVERPVRDPLAAQHEQLVKRVKDSAVGHERRLDPLVDLPGAGTGAPLEEREPVRIEQGAVTRRHMKLPTTGAVVNHAKQGDELRPRAVPLGHGVGVAGVVLAQPLVQPRQRVEAHERLVVREHVALLGVEQEHQPEDHCEERSVDIIGPIGKRLAQQLPARRVVRGLEAPQELVQRMEHLLGELL